MKFTKHIIFLSLWPFLFVQKCAKDSEESNAEDPVELSYGPNEDVTKDMAIEDWEQFLKQSQEDIDNVEVNIGNLQIHIDETDDDEKQSWQQVCDASNLALIKLKASRSKRNKAFENELSTYDKTLYRQNETFETQFNNDMKVIEKDLETLFEQLRSGYNK
ncbi:hypothetical protein [Flavobacterium sp.]|uniref:hypothetical protein n=1 Tax=Flavobacterium sp. TaxID=239 RepID=UPI00260BAA06|nr:hypothetical protein [Flavobacterium sp.]